MKLVSFSLRILILLSLVYSCKKETFTEAYLRGGNSLVSADNGNMLIAGFNMPEGSSYQAYLLKVDASGNKLWEKNFGGGNIDGFNKVIQSAGGGYTATGFYSKNSDTYSELVIIHTNEAGEQQWLTSYGDTSTCRGFGITQSIDNGYVACGYAIKYDEYDRDIFIAKVDASGNKIWEKEFGKKGDNIYSSFNDEAYAIIGDGNAGYYVTGSMNGSPSCCGTGFLMKLNASGDSVWKKNYEFSRGISLIRLSDGDLVLCGTIESNSQDVIVYRTDSTGNVLWKRPLGGSGYDFCSSIVETTDGGVAISGISSDKSGSTTQFVSLTKLKADGTISWSKTYGNNNVNQGMGIIRHSDGGFSITGLSNDGGSYIFLNKTSSDGTELWQKKLQ